jgi:mono/diheme cytochrome c family protein
LRHASLVALALFLGVSAQTPRLNATPLQAPAPAAVASTSPAPAFVSQYCVTCHNTRLKSGGLALDALDATNVATDTETWEKVVRKLRMGAMPPLGAKRADEETSKRVIASLETALDKTAAANPNPGRPPLHRLNRAEYANAVRDLLDLDVEVASLLPPDDAAFGFDNVADVLGVSPLLLERYVDAAAEISEVAIGAPEIPTGSTVYRARQDLSQDRHIEGLPLGTVGGMVKRHQFPLDAEYELRVKLYRTNVGTMRGLEYEHDVEISVDGQRVHVARIGGTEDLKKLFINGNTTGLGDEVDGRLKIRLPLKAGPHSVGVSFSGKSSASDTKQLKSYERSSSDTYDWSGHPHVDSLTIAGPFNATGPGDTPSRRKIFVCRPATAAAESACAKTILTTLARRAYRQPVADADLQRLLGFYQEGRREGSFDTGIQTALQRILASPKFVFRAERDPDGVAPGAPYRLTDLELASRLSFFLWSSIPDDELLRVAEQGRLRTPAVLSQQVRRMLADKKSSALVANFAGQWLQLRNLRNMMPNSEEFPDFDDNLRQAFQRETELFVESIVREDRSALDLLSADYTFVNERLARHYKMRGVYGSHFRRVPVTDEARRGLLGKGGVLMVTSHVDRTSPVARGKWILDNLLGAPPPPPPADVPPFPEGEESKSKSVRERMEQHRANPVCASCHRVMDPLGFALENFDAVGAWRTKDGGQPIDVSGQLADGTQVNGAVMLRQALLSKPDVLVTTLTEKLMTYGVGRGVGYADMPTVRTIVRDAAANNYRFSSLVLGIVSSKPFQMRMKAQDSNQGAPGDQGKRASR